jgi:hypothetical protein
MAPLGGQFLLAMLGSNETMCEENARATYEEALKQIDPPDTSFNAVALPPASRALGNTASCRKLRGALKRKCAKILAASKLYERALNNWTAVEGAIDTTLNRGNTAEQQNSAPGEQLQQAALAVEGSEEQSADTALNSAGRALARALRTARINLALSARAAAEAEHKLVAGKLPASVLRQLAAAGITHTDLKSVFTTAFAHLKPGPLRLTASLATPIPSSNLPPEDLVTSPAGLTTLVQGLQNGGALSATAARSFETDINSYADADTAAAQAQALARLKSNSAGLPGAVGTFLITAVEGLG